MFQVINLSMVYSAIKWHKVRVYQNMFGIVHSGQDARFVFIKLACNSILYIASKHRTFPVAVQESKNHYEVQ